MSKSLFYKRMIEYLINNLKYFHLKACNLFLLCYLCFIGSKQASKLNKVNKMILGNIQFFGLEIFDGLVVESAICLETGKVYTKEQAQKLYHLYKIYA